MISSCSNRSFRRSDDKNWGSCPVARKKFSECFLSLILRPGIVDTGRFFGRSVGFCR
jgi:hypothetical protein